VSAPPGRVLVVGGTGMLAGATRRLAARASALTLVARNPGPLAAELGATPVALDWSAPDALGGVAAIEGGFDLAIVWLHDGASHLARPFETLLRPGGRVIRVHGSRSVDPEVRAGREPDPRPDLQRQVVILGWLPDPLAQDGQRWLTDDEICAGVLAALDHPALAALIVGGAGG
jgi:NADPH:quinone reductase-like Zn-dependent oxidoreductase